MNNEYQPNSVNAVLSRIETKLNTVLATQEEQSGSIRRLWAAFGRIDARVSAIAGATIGVVIVVKLLFFSR